MTRVYLCGCNVCNHNVVAAIPIISTQGPSEAEIILQTLPSRINVKTGCSIKTKRKPLLGSPIPQ